MNEIKPETEKNSLTVGKVQQTIKKGMTQTEVVEALGSPNMVTKDKENIETWVYDKLRTEIISASANDKVGLVLGTNFGGSGGIRTHDQRIKSPLLYRLSYRPRRNKTRDYPLLSLNGQQWFMED